MHLEAYRQRPDIQAVVHAHPPITVALSIAGVSLADCLLPASLRPPSLPAADCLLPTAVP